MNILPRTTTLQREGKPDTNPIPTLLANVAQNLGSKEMSMSRSGRIITGQIPLILKRNTSKTQVQSKIDKNDLEFFLDQSNIFVT